MLKLIGSVLIFLSAAWCGLSATRQLRERTRTLESLGGALTYLAEELTFRLTPLPELLKYLARERDGAVGAFFQDVSRLLGQDPEGGLRASWRKSMVRQLGALKEEERQLLLSVGETLGRYNAEAQRQALSQVASRLETLRDQAAAEAARLGRVYTAVSVAGGAALVLILL